MKNDEQIKANSRLNLMVLIYNAFIILCMCAMFYHFETWYPVLMLILLADVVTT